MFVFVGTKLFQTQSKYNTDLSLIITIKKTKEDPVWKQKQLLPWNY